MTRQSAVYTITYNDFLQHTKDKQLVLTSYRFARSTIVQISVEVVGDDVDRNYRVNVNEVWNSGWHTKRNKLNDDTAYLKWVWERVQAYHKKHPDFNPTVLIDCEAPKQLSMF